MSEIKPNRVHKVTGWIAKYSDECKEWFLYMNVSIAISNTYIPAEIVEVQGGDWEDEKSEIDELMNLIEKLWQLNLIGQENLKSIEKAILEFAKNYKEKVK